MIIMQKEIISITGAGISSLFGLPMTSEFKSLISQSTNFGMANLLKSYLDSDMDDIEKVMYTLDDCMDKKSNNLEKHILLSSKYFPGLPTSYGHITSEDINQLIHKTYIEIKNNAQNYLLYLKNGIYDLLDNFDHKKASILYFNILSQIKTKYPDSMISIFTTNYDLSFEKTCRSNKDKLKSIGIDTNEIDYGFDLQDGTLVFNADSNKNERKKLEYYKLHGSLDWHYDDLYGCTKSGTNARPSRPDIMPILYPGIKGKPEKEPFISLHNVFFERLQTADILIVLGFAFRDPYINDLIKISKMTNKKYKMLYFNPIKPEELPQESGIHEFKNLFDKDLQYIASKIEVSDKPLSDFLNTIN
jgi:NAD-dependent SIR2 family protein deacetylase